MKFYGLHQFKKSEILILALENFQNEGHQIFLLLVLFKTNKNFNNKRHDQRISTIFLSVEFNPFYSVYLKLPP